MKTKFLKIVCLSDSHGRHRQVQIPECDIFIFAGDASILSYAELEAFNNWLGTIKADFKIFVAGNHDGYMQQLGKKDCQLFLTNAIYLENDTVKVKGIKIFGSPYSKEFNRWNFMAEDWKLAYFWDLIEKDTDIVITHGPAYGLLDRNAYGNKCGSKTLLAKLEEINPKYHITGHIHEDSNILKTKFTTVVNASVLDENYKIAFEPKVIYFEK